jgi:inner membrane protein
MTTLMTHIIPPLALGLGLGGRIIPKRLLFAGMVAALVPDLDVIGFRLHIPYAHPFGHRGATHSVVFALMLGFLASLLFRPLHCSRTLVFSFIAFSTLSHPLLDMVTNGGLGVALEWPWSNKRLFASWQVIEVSPIGLKNFFSNRGYVVLKSELLWVWVPALFMMSSLVMIRQFFPSRPSASSYKP